jgi:hypothetical protein
VKPQSGRKTPIKTADITKTDQLYPRESKAFANNEQNAVFSVPANVKQRYIQWIDMSWLLSELEKFCLRMRSYWESCVGSEIGALHCNTRLVEASRENAATH